MRLGPAWGPTRLVSESDDRVTQPAPRHREIKDHLAQHIISMLGIPSEQVFDVRQDSEGTD